MWREIASLLLTDRREVRRKADSRIGFPPPTEKGIAPAEKQSRTQAKQRVEALFERLAALPVLVSTLVEVKRLPAPEYSDAQWLLIEALEALLPLALAQLELAFRSRT